MNDKPTLQCFTCSKSFQFGQNAYDGKHIPAYQITVCRLCYQMNWDGWAPAYEPMLIKHLNSAGIVVPTRNPKGWLPRDG